MATILQGFENFYNKPRSALPEAGYSLSQHQL